MTEKTVHDYIAMLRDSNPSVRSSAVCTLGAYKEAKIVVPALIEALKDEVDQVRVDATWAIDAVGTLAYGALEALTTASENDTCKEVRSAATNALASLRRKREELERMQQREAKHGSGSKGGGSLFSGSSPSQKQAGTSPLFEQPDRRRPGVISDGFTLRDEANAIVAYAFRNGPIENLHAGKPSELLNDTSLSRITDEEMKTIMIAACRKVEDLLLLKGSVPEEYEQRIRSYNLDYCKGWER